MSLRGAARLARDTVVSWNADGGSRMGAALAYYAVFSMAPLIIIATAIVGVIFGEPAARGEVFRELRDLIGPQAAGEIQSIVLRLHRPAAGGAAAAAGFATLILGASAAVGELQSALNRIWKTQPEGGLRGALRKRLVPIAMMLAVGFVLLVSLFLNAAVGAAGAYLSRQVGVPEFAMRLANELTALVTGMLLFAVLFKWLPEAEVGWREVWLGSGLTAAAFIGGKYLLGFYLGRRAITPYGAAGSLVLLLLWVYYSAQILYLGAEFTRAYAAHRAGAGSPLRSRHVYPAWLKERRVGPERRVAQRRGGAEALPEAAPK